MSRYVHDDGRTLWVSPPAEPDDATVDEILTALDARRARGERYSVVFLMHPSGLLPAAQRRRLATHMEKNAEAIGRLVDALAVVAPSAIVRAVVTAIFWISPPVVPHRLFSTREEAARWIEEVRTEG